MRGPIRYAQSGDVSSAYQVTGDGPFDLVRGSIRDLVAGSGLAFEDRGLHELKGLDEARHVYVALGSEKR